MKFTTLSLFTISAFALSHTIVSGHDYKMKRHQQLAARASNRVPSSNKRRGPLRIRHDKRKVLGEGDSATPPDNIAQGTATKGCAVWHTVSDGEVCLGLIDKSSSGFTLEKFLKLNPSLNDQCSNLETGKAYCVDTVAGDGSSTAKVTKVVETTNTTPRVAAVLTSTNDDEDLEDCDNSDSSDSTSTTEDSPDSEDCDEEDGTDDSSTGDSSTEEEDCEEEDSDSETPDAADLPTISSQSTDDGSSGDSSEPSNPETTSQSATKAKQTPTDSSDDSTDNSSASGSSGSVDMNQSGIATYYYQNGNPGNCGDYNQDSAYIVALFSPQYENGAHCGKKVKLTNTANGNSVEATVADSCPSCEKNGNIDLSVAAFTSLSDNNLGLGVLNVKWGFV